MIVNFYNANEDGRCSLKETCYAASFYINYEKKIINYWSGFPGDGFQTNKYKELKMDDKTISVYKETN